MQTMVNSEAFKLKGKGFVLTANNFFTPVRSSLSAKFMNKFLISSKPMPEFFFEESEPSQSF